MTLDFNKVSAIEQTTAHLRELVLADKWKGFLPGERPLSRQLGISRPTLREALKILEKEGLLSHDTNRSRRVLPHVSIPDTHPRRITFVSGEDPFIQSASDQLLQNDLSTLLRQKGIQVDHLFHPSFDRSRPGKILESLVKPHPHHGWALWGVSRNVQNWFEENELPALVVGSSFPDVKLPSFDFDYHGVCRHATGNLIRLGHRRILLLMPLQPKAGDLEGEAGFSEAIHQTNKPDVESRVIFVRKDPRDLQKKLKQVLQSPSPPTAILAYHGHMALTALTYCLATGHKVPADISIISRDPEPYLDLVYPRVCHYAHSSTVFANKLASLLAKLTSGAKVPPKKHLIVPHFVSAESTAPPPKEIGVGR
jgi:DNA-binding transcriptional regulator YhcF (GntR family)